MAIETELKLRVDSHEPVRERLRAEGAVFVGRVLETNHVLDTADRSLFRRGCGLRVRTTMPLDGGSDVEPAAIAAERVPPLSGARCPPAHAPTAHAVGYSMPPPSGAETSTLTSGGTLASQGGAHRFKGGTLTLKGPKKAGPIRSREEIEVDVADVDSLLHVLRELGYEPFLTYQKRRESWTLGSCKVELDEPARLGLFVEIEGPDEPAIRAVQSRLALETAEQIPTSYVGLLMAYCERNKISPCGLVFQ